MTGKISLVLNILLIAAVAYLFTQLGSKKEAEAPQQATQESSTEALEGVYYQVSDSVEILRSPVVAYIMGDSLAVKYKRQQDMEDRIIRDQSRSESKIRKKAQDIEQEIRDAEKFAQSGQMTETDYAAIQQSLAQKQSELEQLQYTESDKLGRKTAELQSEFLKVVDGFMAKYAKEHGIDLVLNYQPGGQVLYANGMDVTQEVVRLLNAEYAMELAAENSGE